MASCRHVKKSTETVPFCFPTESKWDGNQITDCDYARTEKTGCAELVASRREQPERKAISQCKNASLGQSETRQDVRVPKRVATPDGCW